MTRDVKRTTGDQLLFHDFNRYRRRHPHREWNEIAEISSRLSKDQPISHWSFAILDQLPTLSTWVDASRPLQQDGDVTGFAPSDILREEEFPISMIDWLSYRFRRTGIGTNVCEGQVPDATVVSHAAWSRDQSL